MTSKKIILLIEDEENIRSSLSELLEDNYQVITAAHGGIALDYLYANPQPDLILLDMMMPLVDGFQFLKAYKQQYGEASPIILFSADNENGKEFAEKNGCLFLKKPFDINALRKMINSIINTSY